MTKEVTQFIVLFQLMEQEDIFGKYVGVDQTGNFTIDIQEEVVYFLNGNIQYSWSDNKKKISDFETVQECIDYICDEYEKAQWDKLFEPFKVA